jgi:hypothetical protein
MNPSTPEHMGPILEEVKLLSRLVEDLHPLALADAGQLPLDLRPTDVAALYEYTNSRKIPGDSVNS